MSERDFWEGYVPEPDKRQQALDKKAENARELGLDYEPAQPQRWAVFCQGCRKEWSVSYPHPGKDICVDCDDKLAQQDSTCSNALRAQGKAYPRTCKKCGLGPCVELAQQALDKKAENARELGLDYEPAKDNSNYRLDQPGLDPFYTSPPAQQEPVAPTVVEMQNAAANLALMREMWGNADEPAAKVNDDGFIVETGLLLSPGTQLYTSQPAQRTWVSLTDDEIYSVLENLQVMHHRPPTTDSRVIFARAIEAKLKEKNT